MILMQIRCFLLLLFAVFASSRSFPPDFGSVGTSSINHIANVTYGTIGRNHGSLTSIFSPRMDFEQWKPLTGRGDPLRNDPTYDYEPPVLERVHYWADDTRLEREHFPERKSEVLMLGVSSKKPSVTSRQPPAPPRRHIPRPPPPKYEDFTYKLNDHYPMTILVPPPPPPPGHQPPLFILSEDKSPIINPTKIPVISTNPPIMIATDAPENLSSFYALQESNLIYQSSTTNDNWFVNSNQTKSIADSVVSSDYAGWGPTTPIDELDNANETHNLIPQGHVNINKHPYKFYKPMLSESPPPPKFISRPIIVPTFVPTALPITLSTIIEPTTQTVSQTSWTTEHLTEATDITTVSIQPTTTDNKNELLLQPTLIPSTSTTSPLVTSMFDMLRPMMSMPMVNGPERPEDNLYAHASENVKVFHKDKSNDLKIETMQTMQPPPVAKYDENVVEAHKQKYHVNSQDIYENPDLYTHGPYLHMRFTTPIPTTIDESTENFKSTTIKPNVPMYLIIQGHSKVKTYSSKAKHSDINDTSSNEITKPYTTNEVKHLHPKMKKSSKKISSEDGNRKSKAKNLKGLLDSGLGSIELQDADVGIKYDVSDGSEVPVEIYRKGIVDNDENDYNSRRPSKERTKRQIDLEDLLPFDEDTIEEYVYKFFEGRKNDTGITGLIAQAVTSDAADAVDELEDDDDSDLDEDR